MNAVYKIHVEHYVGYHDFQDQHVYEMICSSGLRTMQDELIISCICPVPSSNPLGQSLDLVMPGKFVLTLGPND